MGEKSNLSLRERLNYLEHLFILLLRQRELRRFIQFCFVGLSGVGVNFGTFWLLTRGAGLWDLAAVILSWATATLSNFILNDIWTFRDRSAVKFFLVSLGAMGIYYAVYTPLTRFLGMYDLVAYAIAIGIGLVWNFSMSVLWTWRKSERGILTRS
jgi:dolichol-phosphate mannosyltransferase